jgi:hypothetical protein
VAEAYWDLEWELQQLGFDYCYDKRLYDRLVHDSPGAIRQHLLADVGYQWGLVRFVENHDEPRAAAAFPPGRREAAVTAAMTLPGARLLHEGQLEGRTRKVSVLLGRRPDEPVNDELRLFFQQLLRAVTSTAVRRGEWRLCATSGWPDNPSHQQLLAWSWQNADERALVVINYADSPAQGHVRLHWPDLEPHAWVLFDHVSGESFQRDGSRMSEPGLYVSLDSWGRHLFEFKPVGATSMPDHGTVVG